MKKLAVLCVIAALAAPAMAVPTIQFSPGGVPAGGWSYDGNGTLSFSPYIMVDLCNGGTADTMVDNALVWIPSFTVGGIPGNPYTLTPGNQGLIVITDLALNPLMIGVLGDGDLLTGGTGALGYTVFKVDIQVIGINNSISSLALDEVAAAGRLDFELSLQGAPQRGFGWMLDNGQCGSDGFSGAMTVIAVPAPGAVLLAGIGTGLVGWLRRKRAF